MQLDLIFFCIMLAISGICAFMLWKKWSKLELELSHLNSELSHLNDIISKLNTNEHQTPCVSLYDPHNPFRAMFFDNKIEELSYEIRKL